MFSSLNERMYFLHSHLLNSFETFLDRNLLDALVSLNTDAYQPYRKPDNNPVYTTITSNHPTTLLKHLLKSIPKRISNISPDKSVFNSKIPI